MSVITLKQLIEEHDTKKLICRIYIGGALLPNWTALDYQFAIGEVPTATILVPSKQLLPAAVQEEASVQIWLGFQLGVTEETAMVFGGAVVDSVGNNGHEVVIECVMDGARKLTYSYNRTIGVDFTVITAEDVVEDLLGLAGVDNYYIELDPWVIGTAAPQTIEFSTYGEAINKVSEVDGSPWYALPTGMIRVENRDPVPSPTARKTYFSNIITGVESTAPTAITNQDAKPRINDVARRKFRNEVGNFITVNGALITTLGPNGEQNSNQIFETVDGLSGQFPNGAYWIPTPPLFQHFVFSNELIDTAAKAFETAQRYFNLKNRLFEEIPLSVPADPDVFLGSTVRVIDPNYTGIASLYFVKAYRTHIDSNSASTELQLTGGPEAGTIGFAAPFAEFFWKHTVLHNVIPGGAFNLGSFDLGPVADIGGKFCIDMPFGTGSVSIGGGLLPGEDKPTVLIGYDASASQDFDGQIVDYEWSDDQGHTANGKRVTIAYDPAVVSVVQMTLIVTDDSGRTGTISKTVYIAPDYLAVPGQLDSSLNDTIFGGGVAIGVCTEIDFDLLAPGDEEAFPNELAGPGGCNGLQLAAFIAANEYAMGTLDNRTWNDLTPGAAGASGKFISVAGGANIRLQQTVALFGTTNGEIVRSLDYCQSGEVVFQSPSGARIECITFDSIAMGIPLQGEAYPGTLPQFSQGSPGTLTIQEAYQLALKAGFDASPAVLAVAIMMAESGLSSSATNSAGNTPPSTDRGIAQFNSYWHPEVSDACAFDPECAIREMYRVSSGGSDFTQWAAYTAGTYRQFLSQVQETIGIKGALGDTVSGYDPIVSRAFRIWAGSSIGEVFVSEDSGSSWKLWGIPGLGFPINKIITDPRLQRSDALALAVFGGDTSDVNTLIQLAVNDEGDFEPLQFSEDFRAAIIAAGSGHTIKVAVIGDGALLIGFESGLSPRVWFSANPINDPTSWYPAIDDTVIDPYSIGLIPGIRAAVAEHSGTFVVAGDSGISKTEDNESFMVLNIEPTNINYLAWLGAPGILFAASDDGLLLTMDSGVSWGSQRPNTEFGTTWPVDAIGHQLAIAIGPRLCTTSETIAYVYDWGDVIPSGAGDPVGQDQAMVGV
jgi:hypothetical protein